MNIQQLSVGGYLYGSPRQCRDEVKVDLDGSGMIMVAIMRDPTDREIKAYSTDPVNFKLAYVEGAIFALCRCGSQPWIDAPYHIAYSSGVSLPDKYEDGEGIALTLVLADGNGGVIRSIRLIGLDTKTSNKLLSYIKEQRGDIILDYVLPIDAWPGHIADLYSRYTTKQLVSIAQRG